MIITAADLYNQELELCQATKSYTCLQDDELSFRKNAIIRIIKNDSNGWCLGYYRNQVGLFPRDSHTISILPSQVPSTCTWDWNFEWNASHLEDTRLKTMLWNSDKKTETDFQVFSNLPWAAPQSQLQMYRTEYTMDYKISERLFLKELEMLFEEYKEPLLYCRWFSNADHELIFNGLEEIYEFHKTFYSLIHQVTTEDGSIDQKLGLNLLDFVPCFSEIYTNYSLTLPKIATIGIKYKGHDEMKRFLVSRNDPCMIKFMSLIHKPLQRRREIYKFVRKLLQVCPVEHPDRPHLIIAWTSIKQAIDLMDSNAKKAENQEFLYDLQSCIQSYNGPPLTDYGQLIKKGPVKIRKKLTGSSQACYLYVLEKMLLILKPKYSGGKGDHLNSNPTSYSIIEMLPMTRQRITAVVTWNAIDNVTFRIVYLNAKNSASLYLEFVVLNKASVHSWVSTLGDLIDANDSDVCAPSVMALSFPSSSTATTETTTSETTTTETTTTETTTAETTTAETTNVTPVGLTVAIPVLSSTVASPSTPPPSSSVQQSPSTPSSYLPPKSSSMTPSTPIYYKPINTPIESPRSLETVQEEESFALLESKEYPSPAPTLVDGTLSSNTSGSSGDTMNRINTSSSSHSTFVNEEIPYVVKVDWNCPNAKKSCKISKSQYLFLHEQYQKKLKEIKHLKTCLELIEEARLLLR